MLDAAPAAGAQVRPISLISTVELNGLDPKICPHYVIGSVGDHPVNRATMLLPRNIGIIQRQSLA